MPHLARVGKEDEIKTLFEQKQGLLEPHGGRRTVGTLTTALGFIEATWLVGLHDITASFHHVIDEILPKGVLYRVFDFRTTELLAALVSDAAGDLERADEHFTAAMELARATPVPMEEADACLYRTKSLIRRGERVDGEPVQSLVEHASELLKAHGMDRYLDLMKTTLSLT